MRKSIIKFLVLFIFCFSVQNTAKADVMPHYVNSINSASIGVYQAANDFDVYAEPSEESEILFHVGWNTNDFTCEKVSPSSIFVAFAQKKNLAFLSVTDESEDENWVQIIYNNTKCGWVKKDEAFRYMNWRTFFNMYGRKYGMYFLKDAPEESRVLYSSNDESRQQQSLGIVEVPQLIRLQSISGNWLLAVVADIDKSQKIGWLKWRSVNGKIYMFPNLK